MDLLLRRLERRANQENSTEAWQEYALALRRIVGSGISSLPPMQVIASSGSELVRLTEILLAQADTYKLNNIEDVAFWIEQQAEKLEGYLIFSGGSHHASYILKRILTDKYPQYVDKYTHIEFKWRDSVERVVITFSILS